ncbi:MAG: nucleotidyltransferase family protein [Paracoccaceae bacterium]
MTHLRHADKPDVHQTTALFDIVNASPSLMTAFRTARDLNLPDWWIVAGAIYNQVWNHLTNRPDMYGVNDIDLFYFDPDTSYGAEDAVINHASGRFTDHPPVEIRNQARVHLWYEQHFGEPYSPLKNSREAVNRFACRTHCVALRLLPDDSFKFYAPFGLNDIFSFQITPNPDRNNRETHERKGARQLAMWPELTLAPWPDDIADTGST